MEFLRIQKHAWKKKRYKQKHRIIKQKHDFVYNFIIVYMETSWYIQITPIYCGDFNSWKNIVLKIWRQFATASKSNSLNSVQKKEPKQTKNSVQYIYGRLILSCMQSL